MLFAFCFQRHFHAMAVSKENRAVSLCPCRNHLLYDYHTQGQFRDTLMQTSFSAFHTAKIHKVRYNTKRNHDIFESIQRMTDAVCRHNSISWQHMIPAQSQSAPYTSDGRTHFADIPSLFHKKVYLLNLHFVLFALTLLQTTLGCYIKNGRLTNGKPPLARNR